MIHKTNLTIKTLTSAHTQHRSVNGDGAVGELTSRTPDLDLYALSEHKTEAYTPLVNITRSL